MEKITIELPIVKVESGQPIFSSDFAKEHYKIGLFITDDGILRHLAFYDGVYVNAFPCPYDIFEERLVEKTQINLDEIYHRDMEAIEDSLSKISRLLNEVKVEAMKSDDRLTATIVEQSARQVTEFNILRDGIEVLEKGENIIMDFVKEGHKNSGNGVSVLDVAKGFAIIQKPELIVELNK